MFYNFKITDYFQISFEFLIISSFWRAVLKLLCKQYCVCFLTWKYNYYSRYRLSNIDFFFNENIKKFLNIRKTYDLVRGNPIIEIKFKQNLNCKVCQKLWVRLRMFDKVCQSRAYSFSSLFISDVATLSQNDHKLCSATYILYSKKMEIKR